MVVQGRVENGVVVLREGCVLPEGADVMVSYLPAPAEGKRAQGRRVKFPLVRSKYPGTLHLTPERIAEILDEEDAPPRR